MAFSGGLIAAAVQGAGVSRLAGATPRGVGIFSDDEDEGDDDGDPGGGTDCI